jgi:hypothetical protein
VFTDKTARGLYENVHRSMSHDVILIQSLAYKNSRLPVMKEFFEITECKQIKFSIYKSNACDTFQVFRLKLKKKSSTGPPVGKSIVDESIEMFESSSCKMPMVHLSRSMWKNLNEKKENPMSNKCKRN